MQTGEILYVNVKTRTAFVYDEIKNKVVEIPLTPRSRDEDTLFNTWEDIPKEGSRVLITVTPTGDYVILGPEIQVSIARNKNNLKTQRQLTGITTGDPLLYGMDTDDLAADDGYSSYGGEKFGSKDPVYALQKGSSYNHSGNSFDDLMPGDKVMATKDGNAIGVLEGGVSLLKASELCQVLAFRYNDLLRIISRNFEHFSDFGNIYIKNEDGATSLIVEGSSSQADSRTNRFSIRVEMGKEGEGVRCSILNPIGQVLGRVHLRNNGDILEDFQNKELIIRKDSRETIYGKVTENVQGVVSGDYKADYNKFIHGSESRIVSNNKVDSINNDQVIAIGRNKTSNIGGTVVETIFGKSLSTAYVRSVFVGNVEDNITTTGSFRQNITGLGSFIRTTTSGDIKDSTILGDLSRDTSKGGIRDTCSNGDYTVDVFNGDVQIRAIKVGAGGKIRILGGTLNWMHSIVIDPLLGIKLEEFGGGELNLSNGRVALGVASVELLQLVDEFLQQVSQTETNIAQHIHGTVVGPTSAPTNAAQFMMIYSKILSIRAQLLTIKGVL